MEIMESKALGSLLKLMSDCKQDQTINETEKPKLKESTLKALYVFIQIQDSNQVDLPPRFILLCTRL